MFYPRIAKWDKYTLHHIAKEISDRSALSGTNTYAVLVSMEEVICRMLMNGRIVCLGDLGSFSLQANAKTSPNDAEVTWKIFKSLRQSSNPGRP